VWEKFEHYNILAEGTARMKNRLRQQDLDDWLVLARGYKPAEAPKSPHKMTTPKPVVSVPKSPMTRKPRTSRDSQFGRAGQAYNLLSAIEKSLAF